MQNLAVENNYTLEEYAELEKETEERLEYFEGNVWSMAGASPTHEELVANLITELKRGNVGITIRFINRDFNAQIRTEYPTTASAQTAL